MRRKNNKNSIEKNQNKKKQKEKSEGKFSLFSPQIDCNTIPSSQSVRARVFYIFLSLLLLSFILKRLNKARIYIHARDGAAIFLLSRRDRKERESAFLRELGAREKSDHIVIIQIIIEKRSASSFRTSK